MILLCDPAAGWSWILGDITHAQAHTHKQTHTHTLLGLNPDPHPTSWAPWCARMPSKISLTFGESSTPWIIPARLKWSAALVATASTMTRGQSGTPPETRGIQGARVGSNQCGSGLGRSNGYDQAGSDRADSDDECATAAEEVSVHGAEVRMLLNLPHKNGLPRVGIRWSRRQLSTRARPGTISIDLNRSQSISPGDTHPRFEPLFGILDLGYGSRIWIQHIAQ